MIGKSCVFGRSFCKCNKHEEYIPEMSNMFEYSTLIFEFQQNRQKLLQVNVAWTQQWQYSQFQLNYTLQATAVFVTSNTIRLPFRRVAVFVVLSFAFGSHSISISANIIYHTQASMCDFIFTTMCGIGTHEPVTSCLSYVSKVSVLDKGD